MIMKINKYKVSQEFMSKLENWKEHMVIYMFVGSEQIIHLPTIISNWWADNGVSDEENNNRLIALIRYVNGEDVFEVEKPKKWVVRNVYSDDTGDYTYVFVDEDITKFTYFLEIATKFNTKEEAEKWTNPLMEVVEVEE